MEQVFRQVLGLLAVETVVELIMSVVLQRLQTVVQEAAAAAFNHQAEVEVRDWLL